MAITINGTGSITGLTAGGLPDASITSDDIAAGAVTAAKLAAGAGGKFASYALICDQKASSADGGTFTSGAWRTRDLNTEISDADSIVSIASNQFTLAAGSYLIRWSAPAYQTTNHQTRLFDVTNTTVNALGSIEYAAPPVQNRSFGADRVTITGNTTFEIQHRAWTTHSINGFGVGNSGGTWGDVVFTIVEIFREA